MDHSQQDAAKRAVGEAAARLVQDGMRLGLGTGSTTAYAIEAIGRRVREEGLAVVGVPTSFAAEQRARSFGIPLATLDDLDALDLALDGADEVDPGFNMIKGGGAAHTREKIVAGQALRFVALVDDSKLVDRLGATRAVPVEVLPMALTPVSRALKRLGAEPVLRMAVRKDGPVVTDQGMWIVDARFPPIEDPAALAVELQAIPGVLEHGLFIGMADEVLVATADGSVRSISPNT
ncbi:MAG: ribose-5-phosphate isomerase RpiA [Rhodothermales bacterium]